jgi:MFS family permease
MISALAIALISGVVGQVPAQRTTVLADIRAAITFLRSTSALLWGAIMGAGTTFGLLLIESNMITYLVHYRHQAVALVGVVFASLGAGALIGALVTPRILRKAPPGLVIIGCMVGGGLATALLLIARDVAEISVTWVLVGACSMIFTVTFYTLRHQLVPNEMLGRVVVITRVIGWGALPIAPLVGGALLGAVGAFWPVIVVSAALQVGVGVIGFFTPLRTANPAGQTAAESASGT